MEHRDSDEEEDQERPRPRVVDRRISAGGHSGTTAAPEPQVPSPPPQQPEQEPAPAGAPVWTPEQEAEARQMAQQIAEVPAVEWVVNAALTLVNVAAAKLELGDPAEARLAIDALAGLINSVGPQLTGAETPLRNTLSQLQMAYAERVAPPPNA